MRSSANRISGGFNPAAARAAAGSAVPAPGFRDAGDVGKFGDLLNVGNYSESWSSSFSAPYAYYLHFNLTVVQHSVPHGRAHGFPVRCLQAFIAQGRFLFLLETDLLIFGTTETACVFPECFRPDWSCKQSETINSAAH
ncbi:hypothetical protein [uncultured Rikenella sp.]|uniref:hypothetical protein n=1 Tax=uncultured Rikenella sp. TaxID=368003 RepID=UPI0026025BC0|nr:hypothetical protein [uncultured Rikenella sp.]